MTTITNTATTNDDGTNGADPTPSDNTATDTDTLVALPDLMISKTDNVTNTTPGSMLGYVITYRNIGDQNSTGVVITETVPPNTTFVPASSTAGWVFTSTTAGATITFPVGNLAAQAPAQTVNFVLQVANTVPASATQIINTATIADDGNNGIDPNLANNTTTDTDTLDAQPDLTISKTDSQTNVIPGQPLIYVITYRNVGSQNATGVFITETVPANTTFVPGSSTPGWTLVGNTATFNIGALAAGAAAQTVNFAVQVNATVPAGATQIINTATIDDDHNNGVDPTPLNNTTTDTDVLDAQPDLTISKTDSQTNVTPGQQLTYVITYRNVGNQNATGVVITETVPANCSFIAGSSTIGWNFTTTTSAGSTITFPVGALAALAPAQTVNFVVQINPTVPAGVTQVVNTATIDDDHANGIDPTPSNNTTTDTDTLVAQPDLTISKTDSQTNVIPGQTLTYVITYRNVGNQDATGVFITETVPVNTVFLSGNSTPGWTLAGSTATFNIGALSAQATAQTVMFAVKITASVPAGATQIVNNRDHRRRPHQWRRSDSRRQHDDRQPMSSTRNPISRSTRPTAKPTSCPAKS